ncbi:MAG TPA: hypothetical protein VFO41_05490 [Alphaproteobacteria bacterium]|nr:hypothetical protein [Alphaproteobacteria bacterium]
MSKAVNSVLFHSMSAARGILVLSLDLLAALSLLGAGLMFVVGLSVGQGQWTLSLIPLIAALIFQLSSRLYDLALRRLDPKGRILGPVAADSIATQA